MKKALILLLLLPGVLCAQKVSVENDTVYKDAVPYCLILKQGEALSPIYSIRTLTNVEIAVAKSDPSVGTNSAGVAYERITFTGSGAIAHFANGIPFVKRLAKAIVENNLIVDNAINPEGEKRFLALYPSQIKDQATVVVNVNTSGPDYTTVERNRSAAVMEINGTISQGGTTIGRCTSSDNNSGGKISTTIKYYLQNGVQCATATCDNIGAKTATVVTLKDNRTHTVNITNSAVKEKEIAQWLADNYYL